MKARLEAFWRIFRATLGSTLQKDASLLAAGLAFFALLSMAPFVIIAVAVGGAIFGADAARAELFARLSDELGPKAAQIVVSMTESAKDLGSLSVATIISVIVLFWWASRLFMEARRALNSLWEIPQPPNPSWRTAVFGYLRGRLAAAVGVVLFGVIFLLLLGSRVVLNITIGATEDLNVLDLPLPIWSTIESALALSITAALVVVIYKLLPSRKLRGKPLWIGAFTTALLLLLGRTLVAFYLSTSSLASAYGAAGSLIVFLVWAYYSSLAFLFGARLTYVLAHPPPPDPLAPDLGET